jgi:hypothetical protein
MNQNKYKPITITPEIHGYKLFFTILIILLLSSCSTDKIICAKIPITIYPKINIPEKPKLYTSKLSKDSSAMQVEKAHVNDLDALTTYSTNLINLLEAINNENRKTGMP